MTASLLLVGVSHRTAPVGVRDALAAAEAELAAMPGRVVLATCNRLEVYAAVEDVAGARAGVIDVLACAGGVDELQLATTVRTLRGDAVAHHLCRVAAGLDSPIVGEPEILGQVRAARAAAGQTGTLLDRLFTTAIRAGKRARTETNLDRCRGALADAAADVADTDLGGLAGRRALVVGTGAVARDVAARLRARGCEVVVAGRAAERAADVASRVAGRGASLAELADELRAAELVVSCTRSPRPVVTADIVAGPLTLIDLAMPRDVDPAVAALPGCRVYDLDDVQRTAGAASTASRAEIAAAEDIARAEADAFCAWQRSRPAAAAITSLRSHAEAIRTAEMARMQRKLGLLSAEQQRAIERLTAQIVNKLLHEPTVRVKEEAGADLAVALRELFALEDAA